LTWGLRQKPENPKFDAGEGLAVNPGNMIELLLLAMLIGGGVYLGHALGGYPGAAIGAATGILVRLGIGVLANRLPILSCSCGTDELDGFDIAERVPWEFEYRCRQCGKSYELRQRVWSERREDGTVVPRMRRGFLGIWKFL
jgi:hypothetical protein